MNRGNLKMELEVGQSAPWTSGMPREKAASSSVKRRSIIAAFPVMVCLALPLVQLGGAVYLYDIVLLGAICILRFPALPRNHSRRIIRPLQLLLVAVGVSVISGIVRSESLLPAMLGGQLILGLLYSISLFSNSATDRLDIREVAKWVVYAALAAASFAIIQYVLMIVSRPLGEALYRTYLDVAGFSDRFFDARYLRGVDNEGVVRAIGTWDVATTFGGMMALSLTWLVVERRPLAIKLLVFGIIGVAIAASNSRHAWVIALVALFGIVPGNNLRKVVISGGLLVVILVGLITTSGDSQEFGVLSDQIVSRFDRTLDQGVEDSSIQARYVEGTFRFLSYAEFDPTILIFGFGLGTERALYSLGIEDDLNFGFVSNGWLLVWRNFGLLGIIGLIWTFVAIGRSNKNTRIPLLMIALVIVSDNYSMEVARCFFLCIASLVAITGIETERLQRLSSLPISGR